MRLKLLLALIIFFSGFAAAIYVTAPDEQNQNQAQKWVDKLQNLKKTVLYSCNK